MRTGTDPFNMNVRSHWKVKTFSRQVPPTGGTKYTIPDFFYNPSAFGPVWPGFCKAESKHGTLLMGR